jgi:hypothetical protein
MSLLPKNPTNKKKLTIIFTTFRLAYQIESFTGLQKPGLSSAIKG